MLLLLACTNKTPVDSTAELPAELVLGEVQRCSDAVEGWDRFTESAAERGAAIERTIERSTGPCPYLRNGVVAQDLDGDGDVDLLLHQSELFPLILENEGGSFTQHQLDLPPSRTAYATSAVDLDGDGLPEVAVVGQDLALVSRNLGGLDFEAWETVLDDPVFPNTCHVSMSWADLDDDGDLDLSLPGADEVPSEDHEMPSGEGWVATADRVFLNEAVGWSETTPLETAEGPTLTLIHAWTDFDEDGDRDLFAGTDRSHVPEYPPMAFYVNQAAGTLTDQASALGMDLRVDAMGFASADLNHDGTLDYCLSDFGNDLYCLLSAPDGTWYDAGAARGLSVDLGSYSYTPEDFDPEGDEMATTWVTWAVILADLDNDGNEDMLASAGPVPDRGNALFSPVHHFQPTALWEGVLHSDGLYFEERSEESGLGASSTGWDFAMVDADLDGDGFREIVRAGHLDPLQIFTNPCNDGHWIEVDLVGERNNAQAYGARVEVTSGGLTQKREVHSLSLVSQSPATLHFGLPGPVESLEVVFPDGARVSSPGFEARRRITVHHPDR